MPKTGGTAPDDAIRARRRLTNKLIAAKEASRLRPFFLPDARVIAGDGGLILGADAIVEAFAAQFREPGFVAYVRTPQTVEIDETRDRAAETGRWTGAGLSGAYMAAWRRVTGQWVIESELFVTLAVTRSGARPPAALGPPAGRARTPSPRR